MVLEDENHKNIQNFHQFLNFRGYIGTKQGIQNKNISYFFLPLTFSSTMHQHFYLPQQIKREQTRNVTAGAQFTDDRRYDISFYSVGRRWL